MATTPPLTQALHVVEHLGRGPVLERWLARAQACGAQVRYASGDPQVIARWQRRFPVGDFGEVVSGFFQIGDAHVRLYDLFERQAEAIEQALAVRCLQRLFPHPQMGRTVRRWLLQDGFYHWMLSLEVERRLARGEAVTFFPLRRRGVIESECAAAWRAVPPSYRFLLTVEAWVTQTVWPLVVAAGLAARMLWRGRVGLRRSPRARPWKIAQKMWPKLSTTRVIDHELLYADGDFHPSRILHVVDGAARLPAETQAYFQAVGGTVVCVERLPIGLGGFLRRVCWDFLIRLAGPCGVRALASQRERELFMAVVRIGWQVVNFEVFTQHHRPSVYFTWDTYSTTSNVRAMVWERAGIRCVGYIHGSPPMPVAFYHGVYAHLLLVAGERIREMFGRTLEAAERIVSVGHMHTELTLQAERTPARGGHLVVAFDSTVAPMWGHPTPVLRAFYDGLLALVQAYPQIRLALKCKYTGQVLPNPAFDGVREAFAQHPRIEVWYERSTYRLLAEADSVVAVTMSTVGLEALACRKPTIFFDPRPNYADNPYRRYHPFLVCQTPEGLIERYRWILAGEYPADVIETVVRRESRFYDEQPLSHIRRLLLAEAERAPRPNQGPGGGDEPLRRGDEALLRDVREPTGVAT